MTKLKKISIILIIVGVFIPSVLYPFTSLTEYAFASSMIYLQKGVMYKTQLDDLEVAFGPIAIPYKFILAVGITIVCLGICLIVLGGNKRGNNS